MGCNMRRALSIKELPGSTDQPNAFKEGDIVMTRSESEFVFMQRASGKNFTMVIPTHSIHLFVSVRTHCIFAMLIVSVLTEGLAISQIEVGLLKMMHKTILIEMLLCLGQNLVLFL